MAKVKEKIITRFSDFVKHLEAIQTDLDSQLWYRGSNNKDHHLVPGLYRHKTKKTMDELSKLEKSLISRFKQRSMPFTNRIFEDQWELLFYMQHYRLPTRLLDWTENPFIAFYFAIGNSDYNLDQHGNVHFLKDAAIWVLNPEIWNKHALEHQSYEGGVLLTIDEEMKGYQPSASITKMNNQPVALYGIHNSPRIVAQRGVFTVSGQITEGMDELYTSSKFPSGSLMKLIIPKEKIKELRQSLFSYGITESVVYPDLDGLALEIKRLYEFEV